MTAHKPAFPPANAYGEPGLTKRELFAAMAMHGLATRYGDAEIAACAHNAVRFADAVLAELDK